MLAQPDRDPEALADIIAGLSAQGLPAAHAETRAAAARIMQEYGTWDAYRYDLEVRPGIETGFGQTRTDEERYRASADRRIKYHLGLDPAVNGRLLLELLEACWDGLTEEGRDGLAKCIDERRTTGQRNDGSEVPGE